MKKGSINHFFKRSGQNLLKGNKCIQWFLLAFTIFILLLSPLASADVILHAFNWPYKLIKDRADEIANLGYKEVLVAPPLKSEGNEWWGRYQPQDYRIIDNPLGNREDFKAMIDVLRGRGVVVYADIVFNHMANEAWKRKDLNYPGSEVLQKYKDNRNYYERQKIFGDLNNNLFSKNDFHLPRKCISNYNDVGDVQYNRLCSGQGDPGLPDLYANNWVIEQQKTYLQGLKAMGVKGFRVDAAKHMKIEHINNVFTKEIMSGMHVFGEIITQGGAGNAEYDNFLQPYLQFTRHGAYDFPLFSTIRKAFKSDGSLSSLADPLGYGLALENNRANTFVITHDIPNSEGFRYQIMHIQDEHLAYAYILGRDGGVPMVYSDHNESGDQRWLDAYKRSDIKDSGSTMRSREAGCRY